MTLGYESWPDKERRQTLTVDDAGPGGCANDGG